MREVFILRFALLVLPASLKRWVTALWTVIHDCIRRFYFISQKGCGTEACNLHLKKRSFTALLTRSSESHDLVLVTRYLFWQSNPSAYAQRVRGLVLKFQTLICDFLVHNANLIPKVVQCTNWGNSDRNFFLFRLGTRNLPYALQLVATDTDSSGTILDGYHLITL